MAWQIKDEFIDLAKARHVVIFHNPDTGSEHHLVHHFNLAACPHCGVPKVGSDKNPIDFHQKKAETLAALHAHHQTLLRYRELHPRVRLGTEPK